MMPPSRKPPEIWQSRLGTNTFNPLEAMELQDAIRKHASSIKLRDKKFLLTYYKVGNNKKVFYRPADDSFVPAGHLDIQQFLKEI